MCEDPDQVWYPQRRVNFADMERAAAQALWASLHEARPYHDGTFTDWAAQRTPSHPYHYNDGITIDVATTDDNPDDAFLTEEDAPLNPGSASSPPLPRSE